MRAILTAILVQLAYNKIVHGLLCYFFTTYRRLTGLSLSLACDSVFLIQKDSQGHLWFGTFIGLSTFES